MGELSRLYSLEGNCNDSGILESIKHFYAPMLIVHLSIHSSHFLARLNKVQEELLHYPSVSNLNICFVT